MWFSLDGRIDTSLPKLTVPPTEVKAVYLSSWSAGKEDVIQYVINLAKISEVNAVVIDIKDYSGYVAYDSELEEVERYGAERVIIPDIVSLIARLHSEGLYVIARISVFQDPVLANARPDWAIHSAGNTLWYDHSGMAWISPAARDSWDYVVALAREADTLGFDEINFDYIRFPSDGNIADAVYPTWDEVIPKRTIIRDFFAYLRQELHDVKLSVDIFGILTVREGDEGIGQVLEDAYAYFDYVSPMLYPSHYASGFLGYENPAEHPYEVVLDGLEHALMRLEGYTSEIRPWLQDFDLGADYDDVMVRKEIQAVRDALGERFKGFMLWSISSVYSEGALK